MSFVQLHLHTHIGSQLDGIGDPFKYAKLAKEKGHPALAVTDHGKMNAFFKHQQACLNEGIKPIFGVEAYVEFELERFDENKKRIRNENMHLIILAKNSVGYKNLLKLNYLSMSDDKHFYYRNHILIKEIIENKEGLIIGSGCGNSPFNKLFRKGEKEKAEKLYKFFVDEFGDDFYTELHLSELINDDYNQIEINKFQIEMAKKYNRTIVIAGDVHYDLPGKDELQTIAIAIRNKDDINNISFELESKNLYYHDIEDYKKFNKQWGYGYTDKEIEEWCNNTLKIADKIDFLIPERTRMILPAISEDDDELLIAKAKDGLAKKMGCDSFDKCPDEYKTRLLNEIKVIIRKGMSSYIMVLDDIFDFAKKNNIMRGPARGCFTPNNKVLMSDGSYKLISEIEQSKDYVVSGFGNSKLCLFKFEYDIDEDIVAVKIEDGTVIECTMDHKVLTNKGWVEAIKLKKGDIIEKVKNFNNKNKVVDVTKKHYKGKVYDLSVDIDFTYTISDYIVHNSGGGSLLLYSLGITTIDPLKYGLIFERFLSSERSPDVTYDWLGEVDD